MSNQEYIQAIDRAVDIVKLVGNSAHGLSLTTVSRLRGLPKQTAYSILKTLVHTGLLEKRSHPSVYCLGRLMGELRRYHDEWRSIFLVRAVPSIVQLAKRADAEAVFSQYTGGQIVGTIRAKCEVDLEPVIRDSWRMGPYGTGLVFQAYMEPEELTRFRKNNPVTLHGRGEYWGSYKLIDKMLAEVRRRGRLVYCMDNILRVHVPVFIHGDIPVGAVSVFRRSTGAGVTYAASAMVETVLRTARGLETLFAQVSDQYGQSETAWMLQGLRSS